MAERRRRPDLPPRWLTIGEAAQYLGHSPSWLTPERLARLQETGFPAVDPSLERIDRDAIDDWSDQRSGRQAPSGVRESTPPTPSGTATSTELDPDPWVKAAHELRNAKVRN
jgi:hypothetical protein